MQTSTRTRLGRMLAVIGTTLAVTLTAVALTKAQPAPEQVRVLAGHANVHKGPNTTTEVLVLAPRGTALTVLARDKEWVQVRLTPDLRKTGLVMRWYQNEDRGWMHDSTVVASKN